MPLLKLAIDHIEAERPDILRSELFAVLQKFAHEAGTHGADLPTEIRTRDGKKRSAMPSGTSAWRGARPADR